MPDPQGAFLFSPPKGRCPSLRSRAGSAAPRPSRLIDFLYPPPFREGLIASRKTTPPESGFPYVIMYESMIFDSL